MDGEARAGRAHQGMWAQASERPVSRLSGSAFAVIREAIRKEGMVAIGKVVFTSREHIIALEARGKGLLGITLRYPYEVRNAADYFDDIPDEKIPKDMLDLASHIVETKAGHFDPSKFDDRYEDALKGLHPGRLVGGRLQAELGVIDDRGQDVVELVGDTGGQRPDAAEPLGLQ